MDFYEVLDDVLELLRSRGRVTYRALKAQFQLDDEQVETLREEMQYAHESSVQADDRGLIWTGDTGSTAESSPTPSIPETITPQTTEPERAPASYTPTYLAEKILTGKTSLEGERKVVTVLFADIKDSTELIRDLDPEDAQKLQDPAIHIMMDAVHRFEGTVNQVLGDGIMSIFGAPIAHEDHAARGCYAALAMQAAMQPYAEEVRRSHGITMRIRVGLNSGEVVVRTIGNDLHMDYSAVGQTTNLASRMEQLAAPGSVVLAAATLRLVEGLVQVNDLGPIPVKGMDEPVEVYELTGASSIRRRLQAAVSRGLTKFVGRDTEIDALNQALEQAGTGHGQIVAAVGEAGVGKSRLMYEFVHSHRTQGWLVLESASVSYGKATPYFPVIDLLKRYTHVEDGDDARTIRAKMAGQILTLDESLQETIPALLSLLDALPEDSPFLKLDPPQRRQRTLDGLKRILLRESQVQPLLLVFEDLHWHDNESQALLDSLVESLPTTQILLLGNYRPEYTHNYRK
jgi:class 3 adenylate cyclase